MQSVEESCSHEVNCDSPMTWHEHGSLHLATCLAGNFVGSLMFVAAVVATGIFAQGAAYPVKTALYKATLPWHQVCMLDTQ